MRSPVDPPRRRPRIAVAHLTALLTAVLLVSACTDGGSSGGDVPDDHGPNSVPPQTLPGGVELASVDPSRLLVGEGLAYGLPLPSQQAAADAYLEDPEVAAVVARRLYSHLDGRLIGEVLVLALDGAELFDEAVLDAFVQAAVSAQGGEEATPATVAGRPVLRSAAPAGTAMGYLEGDQLMLVRGANDQDVGVVVERQLVAIAAGAVGDPEPFTPLVALPIDAAFVPVPTVTFQPIPPPNEEPAPDPPALPGATGVQGRYGVVAGERRTTIWAFTVDNGTYPSAEKLEPAVAALVSACAGGAPTEVVEVLDRVVLGANGPEGSVSARAFRQQGLVLVVEGFVPDQLDAVVSAWIQALTRP